MNRQQKGQIIESLKGDFQGNSSFWVNYQGMTVPQLQSFRRKLKQKGGEFKVAKVRFMKKAMEKMSALEELNSKLHGQLGIVFASKEPAEIVKILFETAKEFEKLEILYGALDSQVLDASMLKVISTLPSREVLLAQLLGVINAPIYNFALVLKMPVMKLLWALKQISEKK